jgi:hypothetical protein
MAPTEGSRPVDRLTISAYHEAGHCYALHQQGYGVLSVAIASSRGFEAVTQPQWLPGEGVGRLLRSLVISLAGFPATQFVLPNPTPEEREDQVAKDMCDAYRNARRLIGYVRQPELSEAPLNDNRLVDYLGSAGVTLGAHLLVTTHEGIASCRVGEGRQAITAVAEALLERRTLSGADVADIIKSAMPHCQRVNDPDVLTPEERELVLAHTSFMESL